MNHQRRTGTNVMVFNRETISWMQSESQCIVGVGTTGNIQSSISVAPCLCSSYRDIGGVGVHTTIFPCINATCRSIDSDTWNGGRPYIMIETVYIHKVIKITLLISCLLQS